MRVRILNHNAYGPFLTDADKGMYAVGTVHEVVNFYPDTGEVDLGDREVSFAPAEYEVVEE